ncbi:transcriptional regulator family: Histone-like TF [Paecilomyces variotii]|nr:transcriptional regulator family: Histone-like TF [Paecilomyces variotii]KAJ9193179.1 transcriptional regulator family: Histone-like TF [Paecilomyces variotii]KAJ9211948.1 transcriptional regulator family: Histone-like TF [Paecilomyces variotii]KAJ9219991.1 transcriptional regulator family: Histone-like TF [Paecilomyces variotii]KAJ9231959.1 transcriptional regulator family: Histone-like TF [Paecilomyces variotii]
MYNSSHLHAMTDQDTSYRPRSPDFSSLEPAYPPAVTSPYHPPPFPLTSPIAHRASYDASPFFTPQYQHPVAPPGRVPQQYIPPSIDQEEMARRSARVARVSETVAWQPEPLTFETKPEPAHLDDASKPRPWSGVEVKTKFPVARIKRIMQADEDVGKVAQVTPIAVSKALELFMISLVTKAAQEAKDRNSKRVTAAHLKQAVAKDEVLDFLADIIAKVPDQHSRKHDDDGSDQNEGKRKRGGGRQKKEESD